MSEEIITVRVKSKSRGHLGLEHEVTYDKVTGIGSCTCGAGQHGLLCRHLLGVRNTYGLGDQLRRSVERLRSAE